MVSGTFTRVRLFTDIEDITLDKWLDAENNGQEELAKEILDAGLLVEHMIAEIPLEQNLADNSELKQLTENAERIFALTVCFGCNRAFENRDQSKTCPNCGAKFSKSDLTATNLTNPSPAHKKESSQSHDTKKPSTSSPTPAAPSSPSPTPSRKDKNQSPPTPRLESSKKRHKNHPRTGKNTSNKTTPSSTPSSKEKDEDQDSNEDWFSSTGTDPLSRSGKHSVKSH